MLQIYKVILRIVCYISILQPVHDCSIDSALTVATSNIYVQILRAKKKVRIYRKYFCALYSYFKREQMLPDIYSVPRMKRPALFALLVYTIFVPYLLIAIVCTPIYLAVLS